jgi:predicted amidophosphoribosyltransferase
MKVNIMSIRGDWYIGYVLDWHIAESLFLGYNEFGHPEFANERTDIGEAIYQLKYNNDLTKIEPLAEIFVENLRLKFETVSLIIPMPSSKNRKVQPVLELSRKIAAKWNIPLFENILLKNLKTPQMKDIKKAKRSNALKETFCINDEITNNGCWDALIIDDLYAV